MHWLKVNDIERPYKCYIYCISSNELKYYFENRVEENVDVRKVEYIRYRKRGQMGIMDP